MKRAVRLVLGLALAGAVAGCVPSNPQVDLVTRFGTIRVEVDSARAPRTAANFLRYVDEGRYADAAFYRVRREEAELMQQPTAIVQGGLYGGDRSKLLPPIPLESTRQTGLEHTEGAISMARFDVGTAQAEFFIVLGDQPHLDYRDDRRPGYAAFGRVVDGLDLVRQIRDLPLDGEHLLRAIPFRAVRVR